MGSTTAPDPPESPFEVNNYHQLIRRESTPLDPPETPDEAGATTTSSCSQDNNNMYTSPREPQATTMGGWKIRPIRQRGLEPTEFQIKEEPASVSVPTTPSNNSNAQSSLRSSITSQITKSAGAMVLYEAPPEPSSPTPTPTDDNNNLMLMPMMEDEPAMTMATTITTRMEPYNGEDASRGEEAAVAAEQQLALVKSDPRDTKTQDQPSSKTHRGQELVVKTTPAAAAAVGTSTELALTKPQDLRRGFDHCFVNVPTKERLSVLFATLRRSADRKVVVICSSWESSKFHAVLFRQLEMLHVYELHERMDDDGILGSSGANLTSGRPAGGDVARAYDEFLYTYPGILFASDVAMNEFDIPPNVDYVIQYEPPMDPAGYVFRMSNAQIYQTSCHIALLFLNPSELDFLALFDKETDIENKELEARKVSTFQGQAEKLVAKHSEVNDLAWRAFRAYVIAYEGHSNTKIYDKTKIDEDAVRKSFGQPHLPEYSSKYFVYNSKQGEAAPSAEKKSTKKDTDSAEGKSEEKDQEKEHQRFHQRKTKQWTNEKSWRKKESWTNRESKTWRHTHTEKVLGRGDSK